MVEPIFLDTDDALEIHQDQIDRYGGSAGVRDMDLLGSAVNAPAATFGGQFLNADPFEMAAAYMIGLVRNHAFVDGNKRVGVAASLTFLLLNGIDVRQDDEALYELGIAVATDRADKAAVVAYLRAHVEP